MRIGCLQFSPQVGDTENNLNRADAVLSRANPDELDLLVLPELAFSGYNFKSLQEIAPFLEHSGSGITSLWARTMALRYNCVVTVGYPEKVDVSPQWPTGPEYYNSAIVVNEEGETIANYRKSFLYYTDESWALEGKNGFYDGIIPGLGNTSIGICMDINPYKFEAPWHAFEFAFHVLEVESNLVILSMAWMTRADKSRFTSKPNEPDMETLTYWVTRLEPLIRSDNQDEIIIVFCNRAGIEGEATYAGTSAVIGVLDGEVRVYGLLGRGEKELLVVDTNKAPYGKLVYRPQEPGEEKQVGDAKAPKNDGDESLKGDRSSDKESKGIRKDSSMGTGTDGDKPDDGKDVTSETKPTGDHRDASVPAAPPAAEPASSGLPEQPYQPAAGAAVAPKKRPAAQIKVPPNGQEVNDDGAAKSPVIPTPSAPSPTPMAIRPKLIIPESPPIQPYQYPADYPISASSLHSERSAKSFRSDGSEVSTYTIRSNPRPPEESTPYPHSGAPLSGYPQNAFNPERRILGGSVSISQKFGDFSPVTPFQDISPSSPNHLWWPANGSRPTPRFGGGGGGLTPATAIGLTPGTPLGRQPEPFPWEAINEISNQQDSVGNERKPAEQAIAVAVPASEQTNGSLSPKSNTSSNKTTGTAHSVSTAGRTNHSSSSRRTKTSSRSGSSTRHRSRSVTKIASTAPDGPPKDDGRPARPSSPKSRNASRSRMHERSDSSLGERDVAEAVSSHLQSISQRAESANSMRSTSAPVVDRPPSPKSRNCSRNRSDPDEYRTIPIAACPSILPRMANTPEARAFYRSAAQPEVQDNGRQHSGVISPVYYSRIGSPPSMSNVPRPASRAVSRGRASQAPVPAPTERSTSQDSIRNDRLHTRVSRHENRSQTSNHTSRSRRSSSKTQPDLSLFERVESIVCPDCPVHGQVPSGGPEVSEEGSRRHSAESSSSGTQPGNAASGQEMVEINRSAGKSTQVRPEDIPLPDLSGSSGSDSSHKAGFQVTSSAARSLTDPSTPRAMAYDCEAVPLTLEHSRLPEPEEISLARCGDDRADLIQATSTSTTRA